MFGDAIVRNQMLRCVSPRSTKSNCVRAIQASRASLGPHPLDNYVVFSILESDSAFLFMRNDSPCCLMVIWTPFLLGLSPFVSYRTENDTTLRNVPIVLVRHSCVISIVLT